MKVSIVTAVYNSRDTILDAISSVVSQTYQEREHLVIDGASTDGTL
ncbi:glycosyltransferase, partial [Candidatus Parcubacteria bacterium]